jgi:stage V sporulation protein G
MEKISEIQIAPIKPQNGLVGFASIVFDNSFYLGSIGIYTRPQGGYRLTYPTKKGCSGNFNIFHPINHVIASHIEQAVIAKFEEVMSSYDRHSSADTQYE